MQNSFEIQGYQVEFTATEGLGVEYWEYEYNLQNRLSRAYKNGELIAEFTYDDNGQRIKSRKKTESGEFKTTYYVHGYQGQVLLEEENGVDSGYTSYVYALSMTYARIDGVIGGENWQEEVIYFHHDNLGSTVAMTDTEGEVVMRQDYLPFGSDLFLKDQSEVLNETGEGYKYTGQKQVKSIGLYYYNARWYDPDIGRFNREDDYRGELKNPQSLNLYVYVLNNPLRYTDPTGHKWEETNISYVAFNKGMLVFESGDDISKEAIERSYNVAEVFDRPRMLVKAKKYEKNWDQRNIMGKIGFKYPEGYRNVKLIKSHDPEGKLGNQIEKLNTGISMKDGQIESASKIGEKYAEDMIITQAEYSNSRFSSAITAYSIFNSFKEFSSDIEDISKEYSYSKKGLGRLKFMFLKGNEDQVLDNYVYQINLETGEDSVKPDYVSNYMQENSFEEVISLFNEGVLKSPQSDLHYGMKANKEVMKESVDLMLDIGEEFVPGPK